jgi:hypothetical protein
MSQQGAWPRLLPDVDGLLFNGRLMNVAWISAIALFVLLEKTAPWGNWMAALGIFRSDLEARQASCYNSISNLNYILQNIIE